MDATAAQRKANVARRRKEDVQLRLLWEELVERGHVLQLRIAEQDRVLATVSRELERDQEAHAAELHQAESELRRWQRKLQATIKAREDRLARLDAIDNEVAALDRARAVARLQLIHTFVPSTTSDVHDICADPQVAKDFEALFADRDAAADNQRRQGQHQHHPNSTAGAGDGHAARSSDHSPQPQQHRDYALDPLVAAGIAAATRQRRQQQASSARSALEDALAELREAAM